MTLNQILDQLKLKGYKSTEPRKAILRVLLANSSTMMTADEIFLMVKSENKKINRSTVYRNIDTLTDSGLIAKTITHSGVTKVKIKCTDAHHHHLICDICGTIVVYTHCESEKYKAFAESHDFVLTGHTLELHGICKKCQSI